MEPMGGGDACAAGHGTAPMSVDGKQLEPHARAPIAVDGPAGSEPVDEVQTPAAVRAALALSGNEAGTAVQHLHTQHTALEGDPQLDLAVLAHVLDRVGDKLGDQQAGVLEDSEADLVPHVIEKPARVRGGGG